MSVHTDSGGKSLCTILLDKIADVVDVGSLSAFEILISPHPGKSARPTHSSRLKARKGAPPRVPRTMLTKAAKLAEWLSSEAQLLGQREPRGRDGARSEGGNNGRCDLSESERLGWGGRKHEGEAGVERSGCWRVDGVKNKVRPVLRRGQWRATLNTEGWGDALRGAAIDVGARNFFDPCPRGALGSRFSPSRASIFNHSKCHC